MIRFFVPGKPSPAGSKRGFINRHTGRAVVVDDCKTSKDWKAVCATVAREAYHDELLSGAVWVHFAFRVRRPKSHYGTGKNANVIKASAPKYPAVKPDVLKLARAVEDALSGIIWRDDAQIVEEHLFKRYTEKSEGVTVIIGMKE